MDRDPNRFGYSGGQIELARQLRHAGQPGLQVTPIGCEEKVLDAGLGVLVNGCSYLGVIGSGIPGDA